MVTYSILNEAVMEGNVEAVESQVSRALGEGADARGILVNGLIAGMEVVGKRFGSGEMFLPEVMASAEAMHKGLNILKPLLAKAGQKGRGTIVMGTVEGDIHNIGRKIVCFLLEGNGFEVIDLGVNVKPDVFAHAIEEHEPDILGMSALLTTTMLNMGSTIDVLKERGLRDKVKVIVGGAAITEEFAKSIGADGYAPEASSAVEWVKRAITSS